MGMITNPTKTRDPIAWLCNHDVIKNETNAGIKPVTANQQPATSRIKIVGPALIRDGCPSLTLILAWSRNDPSWLSKNTSRPTLEFVDV